MVTSSRQRTILSPDRISIKKVFIPMATKVLPTMVTIDQINEALNTNNSKLVKGFEETLTSQIQPITSEIKALGIAVSEIKGELKFLSLMDPKITRLISDVGKITGEIQSLASIKSEISTLTGNVGKITGQINLFAFLLTTAIALAGVIMPLLQYYNIFPFLPK